MFDWLKKKSENARVYMCVKELKWDLETASPIRRAKVLAMAQLLRIGFVDIPSFKDAIENPLEYPREQMAYMYGTLENMRNSAAMQIPQMKKNSIQILGAELPEEMIDHVKLTNRATEVWMTLFGCGLAPDVREDVRQIWTYMLSSKNHLTSAMSDLRDMAKRQKRFTGENIFEDVYDDEWIELCEFIPKQFSKSLF